VVSNNVRGIQQCLSIAFATAPAEWCSAGNHLPLHDIHAAHYMQVGSILEAYVTFPSESACRRRYLVEDETGVNNWM
jgi:hypothetical protein